MVKILYQHCLLTLQIFCLALQVVVMRKDCFVSFIRRNPLPFEFVRVQNRSLSKLSQPWHYPHLVSLFRVFSFPFMKQFSSCRFFAFRNLPLLSFINSRAFLASSQSPIVVAFHASRLPCKHCRQTLPAQASAVPFTYPCRLRVIDFSASFSSWSFVAKCKSVTESGVKDGCATVCLDGL